MYDSLIKGILFETFLAAVLARNIVMLIKAVRLRRDVRQRNTEVINARIPRTRPSAGRAIMARAVYDVDGKKFRGITVCGVNMWYLRRGDDRKVIVGKTDSSVFAVDEQQTKDAVLTWWVFTVLAGIAVLFYAVGIVYDVVR